MTDDTARRLNRLAQRARKLDEAIQKAAETQKRIVGEIRRIGQDDRIRSERVTPTPKARRKRSSTSER